jgi:hypothetical protein
MNVFQHPPAFNPLKIWNWYGFKFSLVPVFAVSGRCVIQKYIKRKPPTTATVPSPAPVPASAPPTAIAPASDSKFLCVSRISDQPHGDMHLYKIVSVSNIHEIAALYAGEDRVSATEYLIGATDDDIGKIIVSLANLRVRPSCVYYMMRRETLDAAIKNAFPNSA